MHPEQSTPDSTSLDPETWVAQHGDYLYRFALARIKDPSVAEDLVQETLLAALTARKNFERRSAVRTWLSAILKHKIVDYLRKNAREQTTENLESIGDSIDSLFDNNGQWKIRPGKWYLNPMTIYEQQEFLDILYTCLAKLPERLAKVFMLREMEELSIEEICKALNVSATNTWVMLYRARMGLRRCLEINWFDSNGSENT
ncbi:MAG: sigma-70 family RNA polymerase sigma factor [Deltaproteobacteria bacterium]|jgi:RNA polymerase sigma-70 factor (ECF subfamily)|nr:sigma-70 family RNA polymerase sigma factor [Deltaproteobacteria bacterium]